MDEFENTAAGQMVARPVCNRFQKPVEQDPFVCQHLPIRVINRRKIE